MFDFVMLGIAILLLISLPVAILIFAAWAYEYRCARKSIYALIEEYESKLTGANRFIVNIDTLHNVFPYFDRKIITRIWKELRDTGIVVLDPMDNEWCMKRREGMREYEK